MIAPAPDSPPTSVSARSGEVVLVVDDEDMFRKTVLRQLENVGYETLEARDGSEAIKVFAERKGAISAVLLDLVMPNTSGGDTLTMLRYYAPSLPVVVCSGYAEGDARHLKSRERGVGFLGKPFTAAELGAELRRVIDEQLPLHRHSTPPTPLH